jgi:two-component sensor histidine kinase
MKPNQKHKLQAIAKKIKSRGEKIPQDIDLLLKYIDKKTDELKKHDSDKTSAVESQTKRINEILEILMAISNLDFSKKAKLSKHGDFIDGLAAGVNMMGEELKSSTVSLKEKETLLKEIHHRVKNNLQLVQSLLNIQSAYIKDEYSLGKFKESIERVRSMALIHEKLYLSTDLSKINFTEYLDSLVSQLFISYNINPERVSVKINLDSQHREMDLNLAVPCGLMINEMLTNSFKYAFPNNKKGIIQLTYKSRKITGNKWKNTITVEDNGKGFPKNFNPEKMPTLGMQLITTLTEQIEGKLEVMKIKGAGLSVSFITEDV